MEMSRQLPGQFIFVTLLNDMPISKKFQSGIPLFLNNFKIQFEDGLRRYRLLVKPGALTVVPAPGILILVQVHQDMLLLFRYRWQTIVLVALLSFVEINAVCPETINAQFPLFKNHTDRHRYHHSYGIGYQLFCSEGEYQDPVRDP